MKLNKYSIFTSTGWSSFRFYVGAQRNSNGSEWYWKKGDENHGIFDPSLFPFNEDTSNAADCVQVGLQTLLGSTNLLVFEYTPCLRTGPSYLYICSFKKR